MSGVRIPALLLKSWHGSALPRNARWMIAAWFLFGRGRGQFLERGRLSIAGRHEHLLAGSHCPRCNHAIRAYDNIPVLAWFWLRGRCRDCRQPISFRYPLVEAVTAGLFLLLLVVEVFHGGQNLPVRIPPSARASSVSADTGPGHLPVPSGPALHGHGRRIDPLGRQATAPMAVRPVAAGRPHRASMWPWLHPLPAGPEVARPLWRNGR